MAAEKERIADLIERFLDGRVGPWEWDDFLAGDSSDPVVEAVRARCATLPEDYPRTSPTSFCASEGLAILRELTRGLRSPVDE